MKFYISNISSKTSIIEFQEQRFKLESKNSVSLESNDDFLTFNVYPEMKTEYNFMSSEFIVSSKYEIPVTSKDMLIELDYQKAKSKPIANHTYHRLKATDKDKYLCDLNILDETENAKSFKFIDFFASFSLTLLFEGLAFLLISIIISIVFHNIIYGVISFVLLWICVAVYEIVEDLIFEKFFKKLSKKNKFLKKADEPMGFSQCSNSDYIKECFEKNPI